MSKFAAVLRASRGDADPRRIAERFPEAAADIGASALKLLPKRLAALETGEAQPSLDEAAVLAELYHSPAVRCCYCAECCPLGQRERALDTEDMQILLLELPRLLEEYREQLVTLQTVFRDGFVESGEWSGLVRTAAPMGRIVRAIRALRAWTATPVLSGLREREAASLFSPPLLPRTFLDRSGHGGLLVCRAVQEARQREERTSGRDVVYQEIGAAMGVSVGTVSNRFRDGNFRLKEIDALAELFHAPELRDLYCCTDCLIGSGGQRYENRSIDLITSHLFGSSLMLDALRRELDVLLADGRVDLTERARFAAVLKGLQQILFGADSLVQWINTALCERLEAIMRDGRIDEKERGEYDRVRLLLKAMSENCSGNV